MSTAGQPNIPALARGAALGLFLTRLSILMCLLVPSLLAQMEAEARIASVSGRVVVLHGGPASPAFALSRGTVLNPGDQLDARGGGRAVVEMSDGSVIVVQPESVIIFKDYRSASSLRELFDITLGRVRVKINHIAGKPNPYRMNSPTASIAVRGTEFAIAVGVTGDTQVVVYEGAVEVSSLTDPDRKVLIEAGRAVMVQAGQDIRFLSPPVAADRDNDHGDEHHDAKNNSPVNHPPSQPGPGQYAPPPPASASNGGSAGPNPHQNHDENSPRSTAGTYERYLTSLSEVGQIPFLLRFSAFPESHLDSLENPAYATTFTRAEGRLFLLPSFSGLREGDETAFAPLQAGPGNYSISPQLTFFSPVGRSGFVAGGSMIASRLGNNLNSSTPDLDGVFSSGITSRDTTSMGSSTSSFVSGSAILARRFGDGRNSLGLEVEKLKGQGSLSNTIIDPDGPSSSEYIQSRSDISQTRLTAGFSRELTTTQKLGVFYRYSLIDARDGDLTHTLDGIPISPLESTHTWGHSSEVGMRVRGAITSRLFYGIEAAWLTLSLQDNLRRTVTPDSHQGDSATRRSAAFGLGYALGPRTVLTFDAASGSSETSALRYETGSGLLAQTSWANGRFISLHGAIQTDLTKHIFVSASLLNVWQRHSQTYHLYPDDWGGFTPVGTALLPLTPLSYQPTARFSDYGVGWRFTPDLFAQYVYSTDYGYSQSSHTLMLRYTFHPKGE